MYAETAETYGTNESSICERVKEKEFRASFVVTSQTAKVTAIVHDPCLTWERHYICTIKYFERDHVHITVITVNCYNCSMLLLISDCG